MAKKKIWTQQEVDTLIAMYADTDSYEICKLLGRSLSQIHNKAFALSLRKSKQCLRQMAIKTGIYENGRKYQFAKGFKPWNKGRKCPELAEKTRSTQYKKGHLPHNTRVDGAISERFDKCGRKYIYVRVALGVWVPMHRFEWEKKHGPIPVGKILRCKSNDSSNCDPDNWYLTDRKHHVKKNSFVNYPKDIQELITAKRVITRIINQKTKHV